MDSNSYNYNSKNPNNDEWIIYLFIAAIVITFTILLFK